jgi:hypothetical protein
MYVRDVWFTVGLYHITTHEHRMCRRNGTDNFLGPVHFTGRRLRKRDKIF